ncbi:unnamed protein product [Medioppia subpectinata]|uniref:Uncharacterized protein n=1 Tax=Medioppia subpectinata TaxID=1979941 RepID=A0A7R9KHS3_9ACAR|nr:unnamed protein product [Medioppia subpectinata]CAG2103902.1 unnamed protein product [Medioppia subpectinata]
MYRNHSIAVFKAKNVWLLDDKGLNGPFSTSQLYHNMTGGVESAVTFFMHDSVTEFIGTGLYFNETHFMTFRNFKRFDIEWASLLYIPHMGLKSDIGSLTTNKTISQWMSGPTYCRQDLTDASGNIVKLSRKCVWNSTKEFLKCDKYKPSYNPVSKGDNSLKAMQTTARVPAGQDMRAKDSPQSGANHLPVLTNARFNKVSLPEPGPQSRGYFMISRFNKVSLPEPGPQSRGYFMISFQHHSAILAHKFVSSLNAKLIESKKLRDTAITSLESLDTNRLYTDKFEAMFEDKLARDSVRNVGVFYRETVDFGKSLSVVKGSAKCTLIDTPAPNITYRTFLLPLIKTIDRLLKNEPVAESADVVTDRLIGPALGIGNGRPFPDTEAGAKSFCSGVFRLTEQNVSIPQNYYNTLGEKTLKAVTVIARPDGYETLRGFCGFADPVKLGRGLNINLKEAITLRDNVVNYLDNANIANTTLADVIW